MGTRTEYVCEKCGFQFSNDDLNYFVDEETNCAIEHASERLTFNVGYGSKIRGKIIPSFCSDCSSEVHFYYNENEYYINEIKSALEHNEKDFKKVLDEKYMYRTISSVLKGVIGPEDKTSAECPNCGKSIPLIAGGECECPKCGGELYGLVVALYD